MFHIIYNRNFSTIELGKELFQKVNVHSYLSLSCLLTLYHLYLSSSIVIYHLDALYTHYFFTIHITSLTYSSLLQRCIHSFLFLHQFLSLLPPSKIMLSFLSLFHSLSPLSTSIHCLTHSSTYSLTQQLNTATLSFALLHSFTYTHLLTH